MFQRSIQIPNEPASLSVSRSQGVRLRITYPRGAKAAGAVLALVIGLGMWLWQLPEEPWGEPLQYALALLLIAPGLWAARRALESRPVLLIQDDELVVRCGPAGFERTLLRLPLDTLEVRVAARPAAAVRYDSHAVSRRLLAGLSPIPKSGRLPESEIKIHVLDVRSRGQEQWLGILGSQVASEVENARLAIRDACPPPDEIAVDVEVDAVDSEPPEGGESKENTAAEEAP